MKRSRVFPSPARRRGLSLIEVVVSTILVGTLLVASLHSVATVAQVRHASHERYSHEILARQLMTEILQQHYEEPFIVPLFGIELPESLVVRSDWDDVDDYHGWDSVPEDRSGNPLAGYGGWNRSVQVAYVKLSDPTSTSLLDSGLKRITVTVTDPSGEQVQLVGYRSRWGSLEQSPPVDSTFQTWVGSQIQVGSKPNHLHSGAQLSNHVEDR